MTIDLRRLGTKLVLLDVEGTTTPIAFVHDVLFPYARAHLRAFLCAPVDGGASEAIDGLREEHSREESGDRPPRWNGSAPDAAADYAEWLMDRDRKSPALKTLQGLIWEEGYAAGELRGDVFEDVPPALARFTDSGVRCAIYSSGSVLAQRLLFSTTRFGDLTPMLTGFFDTAVGAKRSPESYHRIAREAGLAPPDLLFVSDVGAELDAASAAGLATVLCIRPGNPPQPASEDSPVIRSFDDISV